MNLDNPSVAQIKHEHQIRRTLKTLKNKAREARKNARDHATRTQRNYSKAAEFEAMAVAYDASASILVQDYAFLKVMR